MDLLTRGAGFGYIGSTITSLIYASFTFIFFALEAAVMAYALELAFDIPPAWGYLMCALVVIPLVTHGVTAISRLQVWTQPLWLVMLVLPYVFVFRAQPHPAVRPGALRGRAGGPGFNLLAFGAALTVGIALITQMGEQADYLRFMPEKTAGQRAARWWAACWWAARAGWCLGVLKMLGGALLAYLAHDAHGAGRPRGRPQPDVPGGLRDRVSALRLGGGGHGAVRGRLAAQDQRHQRLRRLAGLEQLLLAADAQPPGAGGVDGVQHLHRADADGDERLQALGMCWACIPTSPSPG
jgi:hypothetical protein